METKVKDERVEENERRAAGLLRAQIIANALKLVAVTAEPEARGPNRAEPPPNPNGGFVEEFITKGSGKGTETRWVDPDGVYESHPLYKTWKSGRINDEQFNASWEYRLIVLKGEARGIDCTQRLDRVIGSSPALPITEGQCDAIRARVCVEWLLSQNHRNIVRMICTEGYTPSDAIRHVDRGYARTVTNVLRHTLDALSEAFAKAKKINFRLPIGE